MFESPYERYLELLVELQLRRRTEDPNDESEISNRWLDQMDVLWEEMSAEERAKRNGEGDIPDWVTAAVSVLMRIPEDDEQEALEGLIYWKVEGKEHILFDMANNDGVMYAMRGVLARLFAARVGRVDDTRYRFHLALLRIHRLALVRLGTVMGFEDAKNREAVEDFLTDPHDVVAKEARELLEDWDEEM